MRLKTFEIQFKCYYGETSDYGCEYIVARNQNAALRKFARLKKLSQVNLADVDNWHWWSGDWLERFKFIKEVEVITCPHCDGTGEISVYPNPNEGGFASKANPT